MSASADQETRLRALMLASLDGDGVAYRRLLDELRTHLVRYYARRLGSALAANADDLVQETLMAIHTRRLTYDHQQRFTVWVYAIARYKLVDHYRRHKVRATEPLADDDLLFAPDVSEDTTARMDIESVLATIPDRPAELIRQVRINGASIAEAAAHTGMSETAVKVSIHRGLKALAARFARGVGND